MTFVWDNYHALILREANACLRKQTIRRTGKIASMIRNKKLPFSILIFNEFTAVPSVPNFVDINFIDACEN